MIEAGGQMLARHDFGFTSSLGEKWCFHCWSRDGSLSSNFTDAMRVFLQ